MPFIAKMTVAFFRLFCKGLGSKFRAIKYIRTAAVHLASLMLKCDVKVLLGVNYEPKIPWKAKEIEVIKINFR